MMSVLLVFIFLLNTLQLIPVLSQCQPNTYSKDMIENMIIPDSEALSCLPNLGFDMCVKLCEYSTFCSYIDHSSDTLLCCLMKTTSVQMDISNCVLTYDNAAYVIKTQHCGQCFCPEGATCRPVKSGGHFCVDLIDLVETCPIDRYLVTGKYGVPGDRVSFSSVNNHPNYFWYILYQIDSDFGWQAGSNDLNQWIQVLFYRRKLVTGVVTRGVLYHNIHVTEYRIEYLSTSNKWKNVLSPSGNITIFPGNIDGGTKKANYLSHPIRTTGIRLSPVSWYTAIIMRFDILGC